MRQRAASVGFALLVSLLPTIDARAGSSNAELTCKATHKKWAGLVLKGEIPGDYTEFTLRLENADGRIDMNERENTIHVIDSFGDGVFTLAVGAKGDRNLHLYAVPSSVRTKEITGGIKASFEAVLRLAPKPGKTTASGYYDFLHDVRMKCDYSYDV